MHRATKSHTVGGQYFLSVLEKKAGRHFAAVLKQLNFASQREVRTLLRRVARLERLTRPELPLEHESLASMNASVTRPRTQGTSLRRYAGVLWDEV